MLHLVLLTNISVAWTNSKIKLLNLFFPTHGDVEKGFNNTS